MEGVSPHLSDTRCLALRTYTSNHTDDYPESTKKSNNRDCPRCNKALNQIPIVFIKCRCVATNSHYNGMKRSQATSFSMRASLALYHTHKTTFEFQKTRSTHISPSCSRIFTLKNQNARANARQSKVSTVKLRLSFHRVQAKLSSLLFAPCAKKQKQKVFSSRYNQET